MSKMAEWIEVMAFAALLLLLLPRMLQPYGKATAASPNEPIRY